MPGIKRHYTKTKLLNTVKSKENVDIYFIDKLIANLEKKQNSLWHYLFDLSHDRTAENALLKSLKKFRKSNNKNIISDLCWRHLLTFYQNADKNGLNNSSSIHRFIQNLFINAFGNSRSYTKSMGKENAPRREYNPAFNDPAIYETYKYCRRHCQV